MAKLEEMRAQIKRSEERLTYFERMMKERPRLLGVWRYWWHWYRMRRISWLTTLWLEELHAWKKEVRGFEKEVKEELPKYLIEVERAKRQKEIMKRSAVIRKNLNVIEDGITIVKREEADTEQIARARNWRIRHPRPHRTMVSWIAAKRRRLTRIRHWIREIRRELPPRLYRIKIRLYNMQRAPTPTGMFQGFFDVDALIDPETKLVDWEWWLTKEEINIAKYHMVGYFKGMAKWRGPEQISLAYFDEPTGIPAEDEIARYKRTGQGVPYTKRVPTDVIAKVEALTVGELIVGESSKEPEPNLEPTSDNMGVFVQRFMVITAEGTIKWDEIRNKWAYHPTESMVEKVKKEL